MFEDSTFESSNRIQSKSRYWMIFTFFVCTGVLLVAILIPLVYYDALPRAAMTTMLVAPPPPPPPPPPPAPEVHVVQVKPQMMNNQLTAPTRIPKDIKMVTEKEAPPTTFGVAGMDSGMGNGSAGGVIGGVFGNSTPAPVVKVAAPKKVTISGGVMAGSVIQQIKPIYPPIAKAARQSGTVVLHAIISKTGTIENLQVISGNAMLQQAALDAVRQWRYRPYLLNGDPVEVDTTVNVVFNLGGG